MVLRTGQTFWDGGRIFLFFYLYSFSNIQQLVNLCTADGITYKQEIKPTKTWIEWLLFRRHSLHGPVGWTQILTRPEPWFSSKGFLHLITSNCSSFIFHFFYHQSISNYLWCNLNKKKARSVHIGRRISYRILHNGGFQLLTSRNDIHLRISLYTFISPVHIAVLQFRTYQRYP